MESKQQHDGDGEQEIKARGPPAMGRGHALPEMLPQGSDGSGFIVLLVHHFRDQFMQPPPCMRQHWDAPQPTGSDVEVCRGATRLSCFSSWADSHLGQTGLSLPRTRISEDVPQAAQA